MVVRLTNRPHFPSHLLRSFADRWLMSKPRRTTTDHIDVRMTPSGRDFSWTVPERALEVVRGACRRCMPHRSLVRHRRCEVEVARRGRKGSR